MPLLTRGLLAYRRFFFFVSLPPLFPPFPQATCVSAPFNYVRNIKYGWSAKSVPPHSWTILLDLARETRVVAHPAKHVQERLRLGWGTARVAVGMAVGQYLYEFTKVQLDLAHSQKHAAEVAAATKVKF